MDSVEVIRDINALTIRWANASGDLWSVTKSFNLGTRELEEAQVDCSRPDWPLEEGKQANRLADQMDAVFTRPDMFDLVQIAGWCAADGMPATIRPVGGTIYIALAPKKGTKE